MRLLIISAMCSGLFAAASPSLEAQQPAKIQEPAAEAAEAAASVQVRLFENLGEYHYPIATADVRGWFRHYGYRVTDN